MALRPTFISLFAGAGGLDLALRLAVPDARCVCYVEREVEAAQILAARFADEALDDAPVWSDVNTFDGKPWRGLVDGIAGGFPCQDLSVAGKGAGIQRGNRSGLFYQYARIIREVEPGWVYIENVPPVLAFPAGGIVLGELAAMGFDAEWGTLRASDVGASHRRKRCFVLAYKRGQRWREGWGGHHGRNVGNVSHASGSDVANGDSARLEQSHRGFGDVRQRSIDGVEELDIADGNGCGDQRGLCATEAIGNGAYHGLSSEAVADVAYPGLADGRSPGRSEEAGWGPCDAITGSGIQLGHADDARLEGRRLLAGERGDERSAGAAGDGVAGIFAPGPADAVWSDVLVRDYGLRPALSQAEAESCLRRVADGLASPLDQRIDRLRACGNGVVPVQGAAAFRELVRRAGKD